MPTLTRIFHFVSRQCADHDEESTINALTGPVQDVYLTTQSRIRNTQKDPTLEYTAYTSDPCSPLLLRSTREGERERTVGLQHPGRGQDGPGGWRRGRLGHGLSRVEPLVEVLVSGPQGHLAALVEVHLAHQAVALHVQGPVPPTLGLQLLPLREDHAVQGHRSKAPHTELGNSQRGRCGPLRVKLSQPGQPRKAAKGKRLKSLTKVPKSACLQGTQQECKHFMHSRDVCTF